MISLPKPFEVHATLSYPDGNERVIPELDLFVSEPGQAQVVLEWVEGDTVKIRLDAQDNTAQLAIEGIEKEVGAGTQRIFPDYRDAKEDSYPWFPGVYELCVTVLGSNWYGLFRVKPRLMGSTELEQLRRDLEDVVVGLSLDVTLRQGYLGKRHQTIGSPDDSNLRLRQLYILKQALGDVALAVRQIELDPRRKLGREHDVVPWTRARRLDGKSFRWLARGGWLQDPRSHPAGGWNSAPRSVLAPRPHPSYDTYENRVAVFILNNLSSRAEALAQAVQHDLEDVRAEIATVRRNRWDNSLPPLQKREQGYMQLQPLVAEVTAGFSKLRNRLSLVDLTPLREPPRPNTTILKDARYRVLYQWYRRVAGALVRVDTGDEFQVRAKRTSMLYEYWCLFRVLQALGRLGFYPGEGWLQSKLRQANRDRLIPIIPPATEFWLDGDDDRRLRVVYDQALPVTHEQALQQGYDVYFASPRNRPDIRIDLFHGKELTRSLVLDAKYRRRVRIWDQSAPEVIHQLQSYAFTLFSVSKPGNMLAQMAIALYPGQRSDRDWEDREAGRIALARLAPGRPNTQLLECFRRFVGGDKT